MMIGREGTNALLLAIRSKLGNWWMDYLGHVLPRPTLEQFDLLYIAIHLGRTTTLFLEDCKIQGSIETTHALDTLGLFEALCHILDIGPIQAVC